MSNPGTGFHLDVPELEYHADRGSLSVSGAKMIIKAPALFRWEQDHPVHKNVFDFGSAAHAKVLGIGAELVVFEYDEDKVKSPKATNAWKETQATCRARGAVLLTPAEYQVVDDMATALRRHRLASSLLANGNPEVSAYAEDEQTGVMRRCRFDWLGVSILSDYKTAVSADPARFVRAAIDHGYDQQNAWYLDLAADLGHPADAFAFIVQEKEPPYLVTVIELPEELVERGRARNRRALDLFAECSASDSWPGYVPDDQFASPPAPAWALSS